MFAAGNFIKMINPIGSFNVTDTLFEIYNVSEDGLIEFGNVLIGTGVMDLDAASKSFCLASDEEILEYKKSINFGECRDEEDDDLEDDLLDEQV